MDTIVEVTLVTTPDRSLDEVWESVDSLLQSWEERFSTVGTESEVQALNTRSESGAAVSSQLCEMIATALDYADTTGGMFDITILPLKEAWGLLETAEAPEGDSSEAVSGGDVPHRPSGEDLDNALEHVDYRAVRVGADCDSVHFDTAVLRIDVGGIAKGYAIDLIDSILRDRGFRNYLIAAGGDILGRGRREDGNPWMIGIKHPRRADRLLAKVPLTGGCIFTSGDYERFRIIDGTRYHHILNPQTGYPCRGLQSLTLRAPDAVEADVLCTGLFCWPVDSVLAFVRSRPRLECLAVDSSGTATVSEGWKQEVEFLVD
jgi:thiamine biosynthesis lipoprotein